MMFVVHNFLSVLIYKKDITCARGQELRFEPSSTTTEKCYEIIMRIAPFERFRITCSLLTSQVLFFLSIKTKGIKCKTLTVKYMLFSYFVEIESKTVLNKLLPMFHILSINISVEFMETP